MVPTVLRVTDLKISNFSWSEPEIINIIKCILIKGLIPYKKLYFLVVVVVVKNIGKINEKSMTRERKLKIRNPKFGKFSKKSVGPLGGP